MHDEGVLFEGDTEFGHYQVVDTIYEGRPARVLYSGARQAAQSGIPRDGDSELLFDYNQRFFELANGLRPKKLLLIGGGVFTLPMALEAALSDISIEAVEIDEGLPELAKKYFNFRTSDRVRVINAEGRKFLNKNQAKYDMVIIDAFEHVTIPRALTTLEAVQQVKRNLNEGGVVAINFIGSFKGLNTLPLKRMLAGYQANFKNVQLFPAGKGYTLWLPQNFVLVAQDGSLPAEAYLRYSALEPLEVSPSEALSDKE
jgi:predicted O-methyltransferase YrrM